MLEEIRQNLGRLPGMDVEIGQPISHRIDHLLSGTRAQIAIKLFGPDLGILRTKAGEIRDAMTKIPGVVDLLVEPQVGVPQVQVNLDRRSAAAVGLRAEDLAETVETAFSGHVVSQVLQEQRSYDIVVRLDDTARQSVETIRRTLIDTPSGPASRSARSPRFGSTRGRTPSTGRTYSGASSCRPTSRGAISAP